VLDRHGWKGVLNLVIGKDDVVGERLIQDPRVSLISATGSTRMGRHVRAGGGQTPGPDAA